VGQDIKYGQVAKFSI
ncbi:hypothetical protein, partial [Acinetobacter baumannii]